MICGPGNLQVTNLEYYVSLVSQKNLIRYIPVRHQVPYLVNPYGQVYNLLPVANYKSRLIISSNNIKICANQIFHCAVCGTTPQFDNLSA